MQFNELEALKNRLQVNKMMLKGLKDPPKIKLGDPIPYAQGENFDQLDIDILSESEEQYEKKVNADEKAIKAMETAISEGYVPKMTRFDPPQGLAFFGPCLRPCCHKPLDQTNLNNKK